MVGQSSKVSTVLCARVRYANAGALRVVASLRRRCAALREVRGRTVRSKRPPLSLIHTSPLLQPQVCPDVAAASPDAPAAAAALKGSLAPAAAAADSDAGALPPPPRWADLPQPLLEAVLRRLADGAGGCRRKRRVRASAAVCLRHCSVPSPARCSHTSLLFHLPTSSLMPLVRTHTHAHIINNAQCSKRSSPPPARAARGAPPCARGSSARRGRASTTSTTPRTSLRWWVALCWGVYLAGAGVFGCITAIAFCAHSYLF